MKKSFMGFSQKVKSERIGKLHSTYRVRIIVDFGKTMFFVQRFGIFNS